MTLGTHRPPHCRAHNREGRQCAAFPIHGGTVCVAHGGRAPQVRKAARDRLAEMVDPALTELLRIVESGENDGIKLAAIKDVLDRAGYKPREKLPEGMSAATFTLVISRDGDDNG